MKGILGKKIGMTHIYDQSGRHVPATVIEAGPCFIVQVKTTETDGYKAIQLGYGVRRESLTNKPELARFKKAGVAPQRFVRELRVDDVANYKIGQKIEADVFATGEYVDITGISIGRGFQGGMKRWGWSGGDSGHGSMFHRQPGSIQSGPRLSRVTKGKHMPGHMGHEKKTIQNLELLRVDKDNNMLLVKGAVPGHKNGFLIIKEAKKKKKAHKAPEAQHAQAGKAKKETKRDAKAEAKK